MRGSNESNILCVAKEEKIGYFLSLQMKSCSVKIAAVAVGTLAQRTIPHQTTWVRI